MQASCIVSFFFPPKFTSYWLMNIFKRFKSMWDSYFEGLLYKGASHMTWLVKEKWNEWLQEASESYWIK